MPPTSGAATPEHWSKGNRSPIQQAREREIERIARDRIQAHHIIFLERHPDPTPAFHKQVIALWHSRQIIQALLLAFRGAGKSTLAEEALIIGALLGDYRNAMIIGENEARAADRLNAIKHQLTTNDVILGLFGDQRGDTWGYGKIVLRNGCVIQAIGRRMEVRGMKHLDTRPDLLFCDDIEAKEHVATPQARQETMHWLLADVLPALATHHRIRISATPLDREALPMRLRQMPDWRTLSFPCRYKDKRTGEWAATWPGHLDIADINKIERRMISQGEHHSFMQEYMCEAEDPSRKIFNASMFKVVPRQRVWQPCFAMIDPARTTNQNSASTGWAVWSWSGADRMILWDGGGELLLPDQIIDLIFRINNQYHPVVIGIEATGLEQFIMQPLRMEMIKRGVLFRYQEMRPPKGKEGFIESLQPMFNAGLVELAKDMPELVAQFLNYPTGRIDAPNALAYAPIMRPGKPIYESFDNQHVVERVLRWETVPVYLCLNATSGRTTGVLVQLCDGALHVFNDYVAQGDPGANIESMVRAARLDAAGDIRLVGGLAHFGDYDHVGLLPAVRGLPAELARGGEPLAGRTVIRELLERNHKGAPMVLVQQSAHWTVNAFASGYAQEVTKEGELRENPPDTVYTTLMQGLEAFAAQMKVGMLEPDKGANWSVDARTGRSYKSTLPSARPANPLKSEWHRFGEVTGPETILSPGHPMRKGR